MPTQNLRLWLCAAAATIADTQLVIGKTVDEALKVTNKAVADALDGLPPVKMHCSNLAQEAIAAAIHDYMKKNGIESNYEECSGCCNKCSDTEHEHDHGHDDIDED